MSLITRCPACGTMFKVVADQLKIAQGWVRCGQCGEVFDASGQLQTGETVTLPGAVPQADSPVGHSDAGHAAAAGLEEAVTEAAGLSDPAPPEPEPEPGNAAQEDPDEDFDPAAWKQAMQQREQQFVAPLVSESAPDVQRALAQPSESTGIAGKSGVHDAADAQAVDTTDADEELARPEQEVSFVRDARRKAFWKKPLVRAGLGVLLILLAAMLILQWVMQHRDRLAALDSRWTPVLQAVCSTFGCEIGPPRQIESLVIDSSTFNKTGADTYRLSFTLRNVGDTRLEVPSLELTLTDSLDQAVVRRVLSPRQFGVNVATLAARSELAGVVSLKVSGDAEPGDSPSSSGTAAPRSPLRVVGYRILAFYP